MSGKNPRINTLELRKQLLIAESEINRNLLVDDAAALREGVHAIAGRARSYGSIVSSAATLVMGLSAFRRARQTEAGAKPSWIQTILKGLGLISTLWMAFRSSARDANAE